MSKLYLVPTPIGNLKVMSSRFPIGVGTKYNLLMH